MVIGCKIDFSLFNFVFFFFYFIYLAPRAHVEKSKLSENTSHPQTRAIAIRPFDYFRIKPCSVRNNILFYENVVFVSHTWLGRVFYSYANISDSWNTATRTLRVLDHISFSNFNMKTKRFFPDSDGNSDTYYTNVFFFI